MRGTKAKELKKAVYEEQDWRDRKYKINKLSNTITCDKFRQAYQRVKHDYTRGLLVKVED